MLLEILLPLDPVEESAYREPTKFIASAYMQIQCHCPCSHSIFRWAWWIVANSMSISRSKRAIIGLHCKYEARSLVLFFYFYDETTFLVLWYFDLLHIYFELPLNCVTILEFLIISLTWQVLEIFFHVYPKNWDLYVHPNLFRYSKFF